MIYVSEISECTFFLKGKYVHYEMNKVELPIIWLCMNTFFAQKQIAIIHRIDDNNIIKVADFGLTEDVYLSKYFQQDKEGGNPIKLPVKWMAIESLHDGIFSEKSDVVSRKWYDACQHNCSQFFYFSLIHNIGKRFLYHNFYVLF